MENTFEYDYPALVNALFADELSAQKAYDELTYRGYEPEEIHVVAPDANHPLHHEPLGQQQHTEYFQSVIKESGFVISFTPKTIEDRLEIVTAWNNHGAKPLHGNENYTV
ncbi:hypothetical protein [Dyadobacter sp. CY323]|uniref:hypothetical protein n=1 Tax=Dyadobacter sp. CY323 TaxID=2907302 RepID=UPI001F3830A1|nr:hypothetical protein [Dyadobacter sp. CY323]MCE6993153.1 hypothetical protein [Dyadobacter sp. CY323]